MTSPEREERLTACAARLAREGFDAADLAALAPAFDALHLVERGDLEALRRGLAAALDEDAADALTAGAEAPRELAERLSRLRARLALLAPLSAARGRRSSRPRGSADPG